jgi:hypothetical protein
MHFRPLAALGLALVSLSGCQSYFPNGYGSAGPYSAFPPGTYPPATGTAPTYTPSRPAAPTGASGTTPAQPGRANIAPTNNQKSVPVYKDPNGIQGLGTPDDQDNPSIRRPTSNRVTPSVGLGIDDEPENANDPFEQEFVTPERIQPASATLDADDLPPTGRRGPNPYKHDTEGYTWLMGTLVAEPQGKGWRLRYSADPLEDDYGGSFWLIGNDQIELLKPTDVVYVSGRIDPGTRDRLGKPAYRVRELKWMTPKVK